jgi:hypothetical protein
MAILPLSAWAAGLDPASNGAGIWSIGDGPGMKRWIVIHDPGSSRANGVYHIEIVGRKTGDPAWRIVHLVPHMAITAKALQASVVEPLESGAVYPESFDDAYAAWQAQNDGAGGNVCTTTVIECMPDGGSDEK